MRNQKNDYLLDLMQDFAVLHNLYIKKAAKIKNLHSIVLGAQNALESGAYDDMDYEDFKSLMEKDLEDIYDKKA